MYYGRIKYAPLTIEDAYNIFGGKTYTSHSKKNVEEDVKRLLAELLRTNPIWRKVSKNVFLVELQGERNLVIVEIYNEKNMIDFATSASKFF